MPSAQIIAERSVDMVLQSGERVPFRVEFGPVRKQGRDFRCRVRYHGGFEDSPPEIWGYDSLQAFLLAVDLVHAMLVSFVQCGGRVVWPRTLKDYDLSGFLIQDSTAEPGASPNRRPARQRAVRARRRGGGR